MTDLALPLLSSPLHPLATKAERLEAANELLKVIAGCGRKFFHNKGNVSCFKLDHRGRIWFVDGYTGKRIFTHHPGCKWRGFTEGGTLKTVVEKLASFIQYGWQMKPSYFGPWRPWLCDGDLWGYGDDMQQVRDAAAALGVTEKREAV